MTQITHKTNLTIVVKIIDLDTSHIYNDNHMVGIDKIFSSVCVDLLGFYYSFEAQFE
jgi:hypothetical protein